MYQLFQIKVPPSSRYLSMNQQDLASCTNFICSLCFFALKLWNKVSVLIHSEGAEAYP